ncbi:zinc ribbon domain-containing protein [Okeania sp. KiyG1]|uniref:zinc ribbon domain-containing protein n=1 Tax=Okeania sp. KiyG1 TaxID=2720165 RepID=UPI0027D9F6A1|nr:zinc ribbon domain-containing protein [Okeania sp. KiyG1]
MKYYLNIYWKRGKYFAKIDKNHTSQKCPKCGQIENKKLSFCIAFRKNRKHICSSCEYQTNRDIAAAKVIRNRGLIAVGRTVK